MTSRLADTVRSVPPERLLLSDLSAAEVAKMIGDLASSLPAEGLAGQVIGLQGANDASWVVGLLGLLRVGARPLLVGYDSPPPERERLLASAGGSGCLITTEGRQPRLVAPPGSPARVDAVGGQMVPGPAVLLASSGSTGAPKLVTRSDASLLDEGHRYVAAGLITAADTLALPLPMTHAYALGWVVAALMVGARLCPVPPRSLGVASDILADGATVLAVVPGLARVLLRRFGGTFRPHALRLVMAGAGYVDAELDARWSDRVGVGLSRNYGSTETGAVLAGAAGLPSGCAGVALPGTEVTLRDDDDEVVAGTGIGEIVVRLEDGTWHRMGDLAQRDGTGRYTIMGRRAHGAVRRGARWISTLEVAAVLGGAYGVADVLVTAEGGDEDDQGMVADYVPAGAWVTPAVLAAYAKDHLAPYKVPMAFRPRPHLRRGALDKAQHAPEYRLAFRDTVAEALRAYRRSEVAFALCELGALPPLAAGTSAKALAGALQLEPEAAADLLEAAHELGLLTVVGPTEPAPAEVGLAGDAVGGQSAGPGAAAELAAAAETERAVRETISWRGLVAAVRLGAPPPASAADDADWPAARAATVLELAGVVPGEDLLQIGSGQPHYADPGLPVQDMPEKCADVCFVVGAVHGPGLAQDLMWLASRLRPGGRLVIEDRFRDSPDPSDVAERLGWLTHGARRWWHLPDLQTGLESIGLRISSVTALPRPSAVVLVAHRSR